MVALIRALTSNAIANIEEALGMSDVTSSAMKQAIEEWYTAWYGREPTKMEDPCQRLPYAIVNKLCKATFGEYDSSLQHTNSGKLQYLDEVRSAFDAIHRPWLAARHGPSRCPWQAVQYAGKSWAVIRSLFWDAARMVCRLMWRCARNPYRQTIAFLRWWSGAQRMGYI